MEIVGKAFVVCPLAIICIPVIYVVGKVLTLAVLTTADKYIRTHKPKQEGGGHESAEQEEK